MIRFGGAFAIAFVVLAPVAMAQDPVAFRVLAMSTTDSEFDGLQALSGSQLGFVTRTQDWDGATAAVGVRGRAMKATVETYEERWARLGEPFSIDSGTTRPPASPVNRVWADVELELLGVEPTASVAALGERGMIEGIDHVRVQPPVIDPCLATRNVANPTGHNHANERAIWCLTGDYVRLLHTGFRGNLDGNVTLYWFNGAVRLSNATGDETLVSRASSASGSGNQVADVLHGVWYILRLEGADVRVQTTGTAARSTTTLVASTLDAAHVRAASLSAPASVNGTLPDSTRRDGSSMWVAGNMSLGLQAGSEVADGARRPVYRIELTGASGEAHAYSYGGGPLRFLTPQNALVAPVAVAFLLGLLGQLGWTLYAKLRKENLLKNEARETVYRLIQQTPGIHLMAIAQETAATSPASKRAHGILLHHLDQLERFGLVVSCRVGRYRRYFVKDPSRKVDCNKLALLATSPVDSIANAILQRPGLTRDELHQELSGTVGRSKTTLSYHLHRMIERGLVVRETSGKYGRFRPTADLTALMTWRPE